MTDGTISRQAAIDALGEEPLVWHEDDAGEVAERNQWRRDVAAIKALPSAQRWIPCSKQMPEEKINQNTQDFEFVLCSTTFGDVRPYKFGKPIGWEKAHFWHGGGVIDKYVVAWMPLPKPWEGEPNE